MAANKNPRVTISCSCGEWLSCSVNRPEEALVFMSRHEGHCRCGIPKEPHSPHPHVSYEPPEGGTRIQASPRVPLSTTSVPTLRSPRRKP